MPQTLQDTWTNEMLRQERRVKAARLEGAIEALAVQAHALSSANNDAARRLEIVRAELSQLEAGAGPGVSAEYGPKSPVDRRAYAEREAGQSAAIDYIQAHPQCTREEAITAWVDAARMARPDRAHLLHSPDGVLEEYQAGSNTTTWEEFRALVLATPKRQLMSL